jgi:hypothetical protein
MATDTLNRASGAQAVTRLPGRVAFSVTWRHAIRGALLWSAVFGLITWSEATQFAKEYPTAADRARLVATMGTDVGFQAIFGPGRQIDTVAGYVSAHLVGVLSIIGAVWGLLTGTRLLRGEEESGRWELLLAGRTTRRVATAGATAGLGVALLSMWAVTAVEYVVIGKGTDAGFTVTASVFAALASVARGRDVPRSRGPVQPAGRDPPASGHPGRRRVRRRVPGAGDRVQHHARVAALDQPTGLGGRDTPFHRQPHATSAPGGRVGHGHHSGGDHPRWSP